MTCRFCGESLVDGCACPPCRYCGRPKHECAEPVDVRFPEAARDAYRANGMDTAAKCDRGQEQDLRLTVSAGRFGWNVSRAVFHEEWSGDGPPEGLSADFYRQFERRGMRRPAVRRGKI